MIDCLRRWCCCFRREPEYEELTDKRKLMKANSQVLNRLITEDCSDSEQIRQVVMKVEQVAGDLSRIDASLRTHYERESRKCCSYTPLKGKFVNALGITAFIISGIAIIVSFTNKTDECETDPKAKLAFEISGMAWGAIGWFACRMEVAKAHKSKILRACKGALKASTKLKDFVSYFKAMTPEKAPEQSAGPGTNDSPTSLPPADIDQVVASYTDLPHTLKDNNALATLIAKAIHALPHDDPLRLGMAGSEDEKDNDGQVAVFVPASEPSTPKAERRVTFDVPESPVAGAAAGAGASEPRNNFAAKRARVNSKTLQQLSKRRWKVDDPDLISKARKRVAASQSLQKTSPV